jgi:protein subunit release factor B
MGDRDLSGEIETTFYRSRGPGGQRKNKKETAVRILHVPTGILVHATESRSQAANRALALVRLKERLAFLRRKRKPRIKTRKPRSVRERELEAKKRSSVKKRARDRVPGYE